MRLVGNDPSFLIKTTLYVTALRYMYSLLLPLAAQVVALVSTNSRTSHHVRSKHKAGLKAWTLGMGLLAAVAIYHRLILNTYFWSKAGAFGPDCRIFRSVSLCDEIEVRSSFFVHFSTIVHTGTGRNTIFMPFSPFDATV